MHDAADGGPFCWARAVLDVAAAGLTPPSCGSGCGSPSRTRRCMPGCSPRICLRTPAPPRTFLAPPAWGSGGAGRLRPRFGCWPAVHGGPRLGARTGRVRRPWSDGPADLRAVECLVLLQRTVALEEEGPLELAAVAGPLAAVVPPAVAQDAGTDGYAIVLYCLVRAARPLGTPAMYPPCSLLSPGRSSARLSHRRRDRRAPPRRPPGRPGPGGHRPGGRSADAAASADDN